MQPEPPAPDLSQPQGDGPAPGADLRGDLAGAPQGTVRYRAGVTVSTLAGAAAPGSTDGTGGAARFQNPTGLALEPAGTLLVAEYDGGRLRRLGTDGVTSTLAGAASFLGPFAVVTDSTGKIIVQTDYNPSGQKDSSSGTLWTVTPVAGTVVAPQVLSQGHGRPRGLCALPGGKLAVSDRLRHTVSLLDVAQGTVTPLAGAAGQSGFRDGTGAEARFASPYGCAALPDGAIVVADAENHRLRRVTLTGEVTTYAGDGQDDTHDAPRLVARFRFPLGVAADAAGAVYVTDPAARRVRRVDPAGLVETLAGDGSADFLDGAGAAARFYGVEGVAVSADGKRVYVSDGNQGDGAQFHRVRVLSLP